MFIVAMLLISGGYAIGYWGINNIISWEAVGDIRDIFGIPGEPSTTSSLSHGTPAVEMSILLGVKKDAPLSVPNNRVMVNRHEPPFPYYPVTRTGNIRPVGNPTTPAPPTTPNRNPIVQV